MSFFNEAMILTVEDCDREIQKIVNLIHMNPTSRQNPHRWARIDVYLDARLQLQREREAEAVLVGQGS